MNICVFGDSIVWGDADEKNGGWVNLLKLYFLEKDNSATNIVQLGVSGDTSDEVLARFETEAKNNSADTIILSVGVNDSLRLNDSGENQVALEKFLQNISKIVDLCKKHGYKIIVTGLLPVIESKVDPIPWHTGGSYINSEIKKYNSALQKFCKSHSLLFVDLLNELSNDTEYLSSLEDGVHPNSRGHEIIFKIIKDYLK